MYDCVQWYTFKSCNAYHWQNVVALLAGKAEAAVQRHRVLHQLQVDAQHARKVFDRRVLVNRNKDLRLRGKKWGNAGVCCVVSGGVCMVQHMNCRINLVKKIFKEIAQHAVHHEPLPWLIPSL